MRYTQCPCEQGPSWARRALYRAIWWLEANDAAAIVRVWSHAGSDDYELHTWWDRHDSPETRHTVRIVQAADLARTLRALGIALGHPSLKANLLHEFTSRKLAPIVDQRNVGHVPADFTDATVPGLRLVVGDYLQRSTCWCDESPSPGPSNPPAVRRILWARTHDSVSIVRVWTNPDGTFQHHGWFDRLQSMDARHFCSVVDADDLRRGMKWIDAMNGGADGWTRLHVYTDPRLLPSLA